MSVTFYHKGFIGVTKLVSVPSGAVEGDTIADVVIRDILNDPGHGALSRSAHFTRSGGQWGCLDSFGEAL